MRTLLVRWATIAIAVFLVTWGLPQVFRELEPPIRYGEGATDWVTLFIFAGILALVNTFVRPILQILSLPITCLTAGLFIFVINVLMFFLAAWLTNLFNRTVEIGWVGAIIGAIAVSVVGIAMNFITRGR